MNRLAKETSPYFLKNAGNRVERMEVRYPCSA